MTNRNKVTGITEKFDLRLAEFCKAPQHRAFTIDARASAINEDDRTVELAFSSESAEVERWFGIEVLGHDSGEIDLSRFKDGAAVLINHDPSRHHGVIERAKVSDGVGRATVRFGTSDQASESFQMIVDGIWRHISVGYFVHEMQLVTERDDGPSVYRVNKWQPFELSFVAIPADFKFSGVGRTIGFDTPDGQNGFSEKMLERAIRKAIKRNDKRRKVMPPENETDQQRSERLSAEAATRTAEITAAADAAGNDARDAERQRVAELIKTGAQYGADDLAREAINSGADVHELNRQILERGGIKATRAEDPNIGLTPGESRSFSFNRLLNHLVDPNDKKNREAAAFELECSNAAAAVTKKDVRGALVPFDVLSTARPGQSTDAHKRAMTVGTPADGGDLVATDLLDESFIDKLENAIALVQCGVTMLPGLNGNIAIPRQTGGASHFWLAENGAPTESNATFDQVAMTPKTVGAFTEISRRLLLQSSIGAEAFTINELALRLALAIDSAGINGSGAGNQPTGVLNAAGVGVTSLGTPDGGALSWAGIVDMETAVANANAALGSLCYLTTPNARGSAKKTFIDAGSGERIWDSRAPGTPLNGYRAVVSNQVPNDLVEGSSGATLSAVLFGNWADLIVGMWGGLDIQVNPYSLDTTGAVRVTSFQDVDIALRHPESFNIIIDAITT
jgi:HK97 family phage major capsid protein